jgi:hypothetical protein
MVKFFARAFGVSSFAVLIGLFFVFLLLGPWCLSYDVHHLLPLITNKPVAIAWYHPAILIIGFLLAKVWIPVALVTWLCVVLGVVA